MANGYFLSTVKSVLVPGKPRQLFNIFTMHVRIADCVSLKMGLKAIVQHINGDVISVVLSCC